MRKSVIFLLAIGVLGSVSWFWTGTRAGGPAVIRHADLLASVEVVEDSDGVPHIFAQNDHDAIFVLGWLHARDRFFQMDVSRHLFSGRLAELLGQSALSTDVQLRTLGLRRAAEVSLPRYSAELRSLFDAYAGGVNAYLDANGGQLPQEYAALELTQVEPWTALDSVTVAKGQAFGLSFDQLDLELTAALEAYLQAGQTQGFDGQALFSQDLLRHAPFDPTVSIPGGIPAQSKAAQKGEQAKTRLRPATLKMVRDLIQTWRQDPFLSRLLGSRESQGSNWWVIGGQHTDSGFPILANDPHLSLDTPPIFYEAHLTVGDDPRNGPLNIGGVSFAGTPLIAQGCNDRICWGSTVNPMDVTDYYQEFVIVDLLQMVPTDTLYQGQREPLMAIPQTFLVNQPGNSVDDDLVDGGVGPFEGGVTYLVPRRNNGPLLSIDISSFPNVTGISVQYTGFGATLEGEAFWRFVRASTIDEFKEGLQYFDVGSQNFAYADVDGNIAYFTSAELPLREDLQDLGRVDGAAPFLIRDGTGVFRNEWKAVSSRQFGQALDYAVLPFAEMPQVVNPDAGFILNANNDPVGTTLDNDVLNSTRAEGGVYYLNPGYTSLRIGRIGRVIESLLAGGQKVSMQDMIDLQANNQLLDAEILTPYIQTAFDNASRASAAEGLMQLANDPAVTEAVNRLAQWDFSTPTGLMQGYDPGDDPDALAAPSAAEIEASVAATIYALWRSRVVSNVIDETLTRLGLEDFAPPSEVALAALRNLLDNFDSNQGVGASGVDFFAGQEAATPADARDLIILTSLRQALDRLASDDFAPAFGNSPNQEDYRWGYLHRIVMDHPLGPPFDLPDGVRFENLSPELPGVARSGGLGAVDASSHNARANALNSFMFGSGPARRFIGELRPDGIRAYQILPGGQSGHLGSPRRDDQLGRWLTNRYHTLKLTRAEAVADASTTTFFAPQQYQLLFPFLEAGQGAFTGFAVSSLLDSMLDLEFTFMDAAGQPSDVPQNPAHRGLAGGTQLAELGNDLAGLGADAAQEGWVRLVVTPTADQLLGPAVASFTQFGDFRLNQLDGGVAWTHPARELFFTHMAEGARGLQGRPAETIISLANPGLSTVELRLELTAENPLPPAGTARTPGPPAMFFERHATLGSGGLLRGSLSELFEEQISVSRGFLRAEVTSGEGIVGFELIRSLETPTVLGLNASVGTGRSESFSAQLASGGGIFTSITLLNTAAAARQVTLTAVNDDGSPLAPEVTVALAPREILQQEASGLFDFGVVPAGATAVEGSLRVIADGPGVTGHVIFGDAADLQYAAALSLQDRRFQRAVFSQVANTPAFFTGLALFNPESEPANVRIEVWDSAGAEVGVQEIVLAAGQRISQLLTELVAASAGQQGGYIVVDSDRPIVGQQLFGTFRLSLLSAVPPTIVR